MSRPNIKTALIGIFSIIAVVVAALSWVSLTGMGTLNGNTAEIATHRLPSIVAATRIEIALASERFALAKHILERRAINVQRIRPGGNNSSTPVA